MIETRSHPAQSAEFLSKRHDGELAADEAAAFEAHRLECAECQASVAEFENALAAYRSAPVPPHASDLSARILRKIRATSPSRRPFGVMFGIDVRWAGALAAALLVVIIGAPVFSRREVRVGPATEADRLSSPIPAYVLDAEEERPAEKSAELRSAPAKPAAPAPKSEAGRPPTSAGVATSTTRDLYDSRPPTEDARESDDARRDQIASANADKADQPAAEGRAVPEPPAPSLYAAAPAETKEELSRSNGARKRSASAPVGGEAGAGASADEAQTVVRLTIHPVDGEGEPPDVVQTPSDERLAVFRGRKYLLVVESGGRVVAVAERPTGGKLAKDKAREADPQTAAHIQSLADTVLRELAFQPGDRPRRLVVDIQ